MFSVSDYKDSPDLKPDASPGHPKGDKNNNGKLDAGDLILNYSDGLDDDGNGYVDDISGWDFMKDDNDPYDDTRYGKHDQHRLRDGVGCQWCCAVCYRRFQSLSKRCDCQRSGHSRLTTNPERKDLY